MWNSKTREQAKKGDKYKSGNKQGKIGKIWKRETREQTVKRNSKNREKLEKVKVGIVNQGANSKTVQWIVHSI